MRALLAVLGLMVLGAPACGDDGNGGAEDAGGPLTLATYNTGLSPGFVELSTARAGPIAQALSRLDADVLCAQELVLPEDVSAVTAATASRWPQALFLEPAPGEEAICTLAELAPLVDCALGACGDLTGEALADCVFDACPDALSALSPGCTACLAGHMQSDLERVMTACTPEGGGVGYDGAFGVALFTDATVVASDTLPLEASLSRRGVIYALVEAGGRPPVHVFCTHLTPLLERIPHPGGGTWEQEQGRQVEALLDWIERTVPPGERVAVLGDLNTGPGGATWVAQTQAHYQRFLDAGFRNPFAEGPGAACTRCADNTLVEDDARSTLIDHVLVRGFEGTPTGRRVLTEPVDVDVAGEGVTTHLSDHYGVAVTEAEE